MMSLFNHFISHCYYYYFINNLLNCYNVELTINTFCNLLMGSSVARLLALYHAFVCFVDQSTCACLTLDQIFKLAVPTR